MTKITKIIGLPGTGKTTKLSGILEDMFEERGVGTDEVIFSSFSRSTAKAIFDKMSKLGYNRDVLPYFRTLHSLSARVLDLKQKESFVVESDYKFFCMEQGIPLEAVKVRGVDEIEQYGTVGKEYALVVGNILFGWWQYLKKKNVHHKKVKKAIRGREELSVLEQQALESIPTELILDWYYQWEVYKKDSGKYEYDDMLQEIVEQQIPFMDDIKYIVVDEAQDINELQFTMLQLWLPQCEEAYFAYDKNQAIYFFNAADPSLVDRLDGKKLRLPRSYRVPRIPWEYAKSISHIIGEHDMDNVDSADKEGDVLPIERNDVSRILLEQPDKTTYMLFRTHEDIGRFLSKSFKERIFVKGFGRTTTFLNSPIFSSMYSLFRCLGDGVMPKQEDIRRFILRIPAKYLKYGIKTKAKNGELNEESQQKHLLDYEGDGGVEEFYSLFRKVDSMDGIIKIISNTKVKLPNKSLFLDYPFDKGHMLSNVFVGTYFASKGLEADRIFLFDYFPHREANIRRDECRIVFTGLTRTLDVDYIVTTDYKSDYSYGHGLINSLVAGDKRWI